MSFLTPTGRSSSKRFGGTRKGVLPALGITLAAVVLSLAGVSYALADMPGTLNSPTSDPLPAHRLSDPVAQTPMLRTRSYNVHGYLMPRHVAGSYPVRIYKYRLVSGNWRASGYVKAKAANIFTYTEYSARVKLTTKGKWRLRAYAPADSAHSAKWSSGYRYVTVK